MSRSAHLRAMRQQAQHIYWHVQYLFHALRLKHGLHPADPIYQEYLTTQLRRSLGKQRAGLPARAAYLIDQVVAAMQPDEQAVLCVGCRNTAEIDAFRGHGVREVLGIDLFSNHRDILVMDMHHMTFDADRFAVVYSSHSLEHALHPEQAAQEFVRVVQPGGLIAIEVPVSFTPRGADLVDFGSAERLLGLFAPHVASVVLLEDGVLVADRGNPVLRVIFRVAKPAA